MALQWTAGLRIDGTGPDPITRQLTGTAAEVRDAALGWLAARAAAMDGFVGLIDVRVGILLEQGRIRGGKFRAGERNVRQMRFDQMPQIIPLDVGTQTRSEYIAAWLQTNGTALADIVS